MFTPSSEFLRDNVRRKFDFSRTDQNSGVKAPPLEKAALAGSEIIGLSKPSSWSDLGAISVKEAISRRRSRRNFKPEILSLDELSFLLWATQGVRARAGGVHAFRTVPSAGCRHALESYLAVFRVEGLNPGLYHYLPLSHQIEGLPTPDDLEYRVGEAASEQFFAGQSAVCFFWTAIPYRMEWRYGPASYKLIALDAGHVCQNLYLGCEAIGAGTCAIAAYDQPKADELLGLDGKDEFVIYLAPVGKI
jgi:SagB-type dehydrogenase family enzyme